MDPVFVLPWPEFVVAERLQKLLKKKEGYSILVPLSRQEEGIDLAILHSGANGKSKTTTIQVKASRTYIHTAPKRKGVVRYQFNTWFNRFTVPDRADYVILVGMYAPDSGRTKRVSAKWYRDCSLLFTKREMRDFLADCKTVKGKPDKMFGFGFNDMNRIILSRGDQSRSRKDFSAYLLDRRLAKLRRKSGHPI